MSGDDDEAAPSPQRRPPRWGTSHVRLACAAAILCAGFAVEAVLAAPGHFSPDSLWQLEQGRTGVFDTWHPPIMAWLLGRADRLDPGGPVFILLDGALFFGGLFAFVALERRPRLICLVVLALLCASPLVLIYQGDVWKDVLFADAATAGFAALAWAARHWAAAAGRTVLVVVAFALFTLAALTRQNGWIVLLCGAASLFGIVLAAAPARGRLAHAAAWTLVALVLSGATGVAAERALVARGDREPQTARQLSRLELFDLSGALRLDPSLDLSLIEARDPAEADFIRRESAPAWSPTSIDILAKLPGAARLLTPPLGAVTTQWRALVERRPLLYLRERTEVFLATFGADVRRGCPTIFVGVDAGDPDLLRRAGMRARRNAKDRWADEYASAFLSTPVLWHISYLAILVAVGGVAVSDLARRRARPELIPIVGLGFAALLFTASFFFVSSACDYRYLYFLDVAAMAALARYAADARGAGQPSVAAAPLHPAARQPSSARSSSARIA